MYIFESNLNKRIGDNLNYYLRRRKVFHRIDTITKKGGSMSDHKTQIGKVTAIVPMKAHSERVPNKNMRNFNNKPLYHQIVKVLLASQYIKEIYVNTDSKLIKEDIQSNFKEVTIIDRPEKLKGDYVPMNDIIAYDISKIKGQYFLQTHCTNPLLKTRTINKAIECYFENLKTYDSLFSVTCHHMRLYWQDARPINHNPQELLRTQDLDLVYEENSNIYIFSRSSFTQNGNRRTGLRPQMFETDRFEATDIDEEQDFKIAEILYQLKIAKKDSEK